MKIINRLLINLLLIGAGSLMAQSQQYEQTIQDKSGSMEVHYFANSPFCFEEAGMMKGIEVDILNKFVSWLQEKKGVALSLNYKSYDDFNKMYETVKDGEGNHMGIGTITITPKRRIEVDFSAPYLRNVSVLVSSGYIETARNDIELKGLLADMKAYTVKGSIHADHLIGLYDQYGVAPNIEYVKDPMEVFAKINESPRNFGYVDVITFWKYIKSAQSAVKMHSIANVKDEYFGFSFPKDSGWSLLFNEFFESGFGFTATKEYHKILEKHLSYEVLNAVELQPF